MLCSRWGLVGDCGGFPLLRMKMGTLGVIELRREGPWAVRTEGFVALVQSRARWIPTEVAQDGWSFKTSVCMTYEGSKTHLCSIYDPSAGVIWSVAGMFLGRGRSPLDVGRKHHSPWCWPQTHINSMLKQPLLLWKEISVWGPSGTWNKYVYFKVSRLFWYLGLNCLFEPVTILTALSCFCRSAVGSGQKGTSDQGRWWN